MQESTGGEMSNHMRILEMMRENNGTITTKQVVNRGISRSSLNHLLEQGKIERVERGVYILPEIWEDEIFNAQQRYSRGIFSLGTALFLLDLTDRTPIKYEMTFPIEYNISNVNKKIIKANRVKSCLYKLGAVEVYTPNGNKVLCYGPERTLCDILKKRNKIDIQLVSEAFKRYVHSKTKNIALLSQYGEQLGVGKRLRSYLEVIL